MTWVEDVQCLSSYMKDGWFQGALVTPPMLELANGAFIQRYKYDSGVGWNFSILLTDDSDSNSWQKYTPNPDFMLLPYRNNEERQFCPILLGEVISNSDESDRWRMLLQLAICARVNGVVTQSPLVVQAIYLTKDFIVERYLAYADTTELNDSNNVPCVYMTRDLFDVKTREDTIAFLRSMYNLKSVVKDADGMWNPGKEALCRDLFGSIQDLPSLSALTSSTGTSNQRSGSSAALSATD